MFQFELGTVLPTEPTAFQASVLVNWLYQLDLTADHQTKKREIKSVADA
jgi:hypothetical protein